MVQNIKKKFTRSKRTAAFYDEMDPEISKKIITEALQGCTANSIKGHNNSRSGNLFKITPSKKSGPVAKKLAKILNEASRGHVNAYPQKGGYVEAHVQPRSDSESIIKALRND